MKGQAKIDFEKWAIENRGCKIILGTFCIKIESFWIVWNKVDPSMQWGVIQDWADSVGTCLETSKGVNTNLRYFWINYISYGTFEARQAAIDKLVELYNQNNK